MAQSDGEGDIVVYLYDNNKNTAKIFLLLVRSGSTTTTSTFEFSARCSHVGLGAAVWDTRGKAKVLDSLTGVTWSLEENSALASWSSLSQLVQSDDLTAGLQDASTSTLGDSKSGDSQFGNVEEPDIVSDGANNNGNLVLADLRAHLIGLQ